MTEKFEFNYDWKRVRQLAWNYLPFTVFHIYGLWLIIGGLMDWVGLRGLLISIVVFGAFIGLVFRLEGLSFPRIQPHPLIFYDDHLTHNQTAVYFKLVKQVIVLRNSAQDILRLQVSASLPRPLVLSGYHNLESVLEYITTYTSIPVLDKQRRNWPFWIGVLIIIGYFVTSQLVDVKNALVLFVPFQMFFVALNIATTPNDSKPWINGIMVAFVTLLVIFALILVILNSV